MDEIPKLYWGQAYLEDIVDLSAYKNPQKIIEMFVKDHNEWLIDWTIYNDLVGFDYDDENEEKS